MNKTRTGHRALAIVLAGVVGLTGCSSLFPKRTKADLYILHARTDYPAGLPRLGQPLAVSQPVSSGVHLTEQIPMLVGPNRIETLAGARMVISLPAMLQRILIESFVASEGFPVVESDPALLLGGYHLRSDLRSLGADARSGTASKVIVSLGARLVRLPSQEIVGAREFRVEKTPADSSPAAIVAALDAAMYDLQGELVEWALTTAAADEQRTTQ